MLVPLGIFGSRAFILHQAARCSLSFACSPMRQQRSSIHSAANSVRLSAAGRLTSLRCVSPLLSSCKPFVGPYSGFRRVFGTSLQHPTNATPWPPATAAPHNKGIGPRRTVKRIISHTTANAPQMQRRAGAGGATVFVPALFTALVGGVTFVTAIIVDYEQNGKFRAAAEGWMRRLWHEFKAVTTPARRAEPGISSDASLWEQLVRKYRSIPESTKTLAVLTLLNAAVFVAWQIPRIGNAMRPLFLHNPKSKNVLPMLLSTFSHLEIWHFGLNMMALWSFGSHLHDVLGAPYFTAFYITGGVFASLTSVLFKMSIGNTVSSLGASGAILALVAATAFAYPDSRIGVPLVPITVPADKGLMGIVALDLLGLVMRWSTFDHAAHLGGAAFGYLYMRYGHEWVRFDAYATVVEAWLEGKKAWASLVSGGRGGRA